MLFRLCVCYVPAQKSFLRFLCQLYYSISLILLLRSHENINVCSPAVLRLHDWGEKCSWAKKEKNILCIVKLRLTYLVV